MSSRAATEASAAATETRMAATETGAIRWLSIHDDLLRALAHTISNRLATVTAAATLLEHGVTPDARVTAGLQVDAGRLEALLHTMRHLPRRAGAPAEPLLMADAIADAIALAREHPDLQGRSVQVEPTGEIQPVRAEPVAVLHACVVAILAAARYVADNGVVHVGLETTGEVVTLTAAGEHGPHYGAMDLLDQDVLAIRWLLGRDDAVAVPSGCRFTVPTLQASRPRAE